MNTLKFSLPLLFVALFFWGCKKEMPLDTGKENPQAAGQLLSKLTEYGFKENSIKDVGEYYLVNGDLLLNKKHTDLQKLDLYFNPGKQSNEYLQINGRVQGIAQAHTNNLVSNFNADKIKFYIDWTTNTEIASWEGAILEAFEHWAAVSNSKVNFHKIYYPADAANYSDIIITDDDGVLDDNVIAAAEFPSSNGYPGWRIRINTDFLSNYNVPYGTMVYNMAHEIGHCMGLRHTNWAARGESALPVGANQIPGTPTSDGNSVMNGGTALNTWYGFSSYDLSAIRYLYPYGTYDQWLTAPGAKYPGSPYVALYYDTDYLQIQWNTALVNTPTVNIEFYQHNTNKGYIATNVPNTGAYQVNRAFMLSNFHQSNSGIDTEAICQVKITAGNNAGISDMSPYFNIYYND